MDTVFVGSSSTDCAHVDKGCKHMLIVSINSECSHDNSPELPILEEQCGVIAALDHTFTAFDCFSTFMPLEMIIKSETNRFSNTIIKKIRRPISFWNKLEPVKLHEMYLFVKVGIGLKPKYLTCEIYFPSNNEQ